MTYKREGKPDYTLLHRDGLDNLVRALEKGETKHGRRNYLTNPDVQDRELVAAALRHGLAAGEDGAGIDEETGLPHTALAMANYFMLEHRRAARASLVKTRLPPPPEGFTVLSGCLCLWCKQ